MANLKIFGAIILIFVAMGSLYYLLGGTTLPYKLVVPELQPAFMTMNGVQYSFVKNGTSLIIYPYDTTHIPKNAICQPRLGQTYLWLNVKITFTDIYSDRYIIMVQSR